MDQKPNYDQRRMLKVRGLNPEDYMVARALYESVWFRHRPSGKILVINKKN